MESPEEWRDIPNYPRYEVSSLGNVRSKHYKCNKSNGVTKLLSLSAISTSGYKSVLLCNGPGQKQRKTVHRLVADAFIPNPDNKEMIDHISRDKLDNRVVNLRWATRSENCLNIDKTKTSTDQSYIYTSFKVCVPGNPIKCFKTLEEAVEYRNSLR